VQIVKIVRIVKIVEILRYRNDSLRASACVARVGRI